MDQRFLKFIIACSIAVSCLCAPVFSVSANTQSNVSAWLSALDTLPLESPRVQRVQSIFRKLIRTTRGANLRTQLFVVDSDNEPWAVALQDGNIILSRGAMDIIYQDVELATGDARMAFVLGHELAHIISNDFWHQQVYLSFLESDSNAVIEIDQLQRRKEQELRADEEGFMYASLAGFDTRRLISKDEQGNNFLQHWAQQTSSISGARYHSPAQRTSFLHSRLEDLDKAVAFFKYGVKLAHFGRYQDALLFLDDFYKRFPSGQALSNLGFIYIQRAREKMPAQLAFRLWYPTLLDYNSGVPAQTRSIVNSVPEAAKADLHTAIDLLEAAINLDNSDLVARINLIAAQLYLGDHHGARANLTEALRGRETDPQLLALKALVLLESDDTDHWDSEARLTLQHLAESDNADENIIYNFARVLTDRGRHGMATNFWRQLAENINLLPPPYQYMVCNEIPTHSKCVTPPDSIQHTNLLWNTRIKHGDDISQPNIKEELALWQAPLSRIVGAIDAKIFVHPNGDSALAIDGIIELLSIKQHSYPLALGLKQALGEPYVSLPFGMDSFWSYGSSLAALIREDRVDEIWLAR